MALGGFLSCGLCQTETSLYLPIQPGEGGLVRDRSVPISYPSLGGGLLHVKE